MGILDRFKRRRDADTEGATRNPPVPFSTFRSFQEQVNTALRSLRQELSRLCEENESLRRENATRERDFADLKRKLSSMGHRMDELQRGQLDSDNANRRSLADLREQIAGRQGHKSAPGAAGTLVNDESKQRPDELPFARSTLLAGR